MGWGLNQAVGLTDFGTQCPNTARDQQQVAELLDAVGMPAGGTSLSGLPPIGQGLASPELCEAIRSFQFVQGLTNDARVDPNGATWQRLMQIVHPELAPPGGVPLMLVASNFEVIELPQSASGLPSLTYSIRSNQPVATWDGPGIRVELFISGPMKVSWGNTFPLACALSPNFAALEGAVASGVARNIGGAALDNLCSQLKVESRTSVGNMFAAISLRVGLDGTPIIGGSIGNDQSFQSLSFDPVERAVVYSATMKLLTLQPVTGGNVEVSGAVQVELKVTGNGGDEASIVANFVVVATAGFIVLAPAAAWVTSSAVISGIGQGVSELLVLLGARFAL